MIVLQKSHQLLFGYCCLVFPSLFLQLQELSHCLLCLQECIRIDVDDHGFAFFYFLFKIRKILLRQVFHIPHVSPPFSIQNGSTRILT